MSIISGYNQPKETYKGCTNCYGDTANWHLYKGYYWCDRCDYEKLYQEFIEKGLIKEIEPNINLCT